MAKFAVGDKVRLVPGMVIGSKINLVGYITSVFADRRSWDYFVKFNSGFTYGVNESEIELTE